MEEDSLRSLAFSQPGVLGLGSQRHMLVRPEMIAEIQKGVEDRLGAKSSEYLYAAGSVWAKAELKRMRSALAEEPEELARLFCRQATTLGWGRWTLRNFRGTDRDLAVQIDRSPIAEAYGQSDLPVCHLMAGAIAGLVEGLFHLPASCNELRCRAQGADACQFSSRGEDVAGAEAWSW